VAFILSKILWLVLQPSNLLFLTLAAAVVLDWRRLALTVLALLILVIALPIVHWLTAPLEDRFARPERPPDRVKGIIVLGGAQEPEITESRGVLALNRHSERMIEALALAQGQREALLVFSGWSGRLGGPDTSEQVVNTAFVELMDFDEDRVVREDRSRNTWENALYTKDLVQPGAGDVWLLVTSAAHMARSMGSFRKVGFEVVPWPVDYQTTGPFSWPSEFSVSYRLRELDHAAREWLGLLYYYLQGRTDAVFPAP
jgi:uncharacterized SAM-binding protein YcdF (DUF218 family)